MAERLILDTGVLVAVGRHRVDSAAALDPASDVVVPAIVVAELLVGVELAGSEGVRRERQAFVDLVVEHLPVIDYTLDVAAAHARLLADTRRTGRARGRHDLIVAACASATGRTLLTTDARADFMGLAGVDVRLIEPE
ncbi:PIN domain-containing protein [Jatrophihabitans endophyticus]|uniref:PIN domain-containing protein n=1 Tax=Jatrophihabitans endophyticus TaxID=1206085 RepID=UPI0019FBF26D|nr:PIN domain-containing protein [Jatrophihabitans endophyticus]MBE7188939.1 PIN domain-containing protein [Jatrophihabitans endophyticus]